MVTAALTDMKTDARISEIYRILEGVPDPEIPVINVMELGIVRNVSLSEGKVQITITPTYSGCPAIDQINDDIRKALTDKGYSDFELKTELNPPWTTDMMWISGKEKLKQYGIAPPCSLSEVAAGKVVLPNCPLCDSAKVKLLNHFSSTACKALYQCEDCLEPFDYFKPH